MCHKCDNSVIMKINEIIVLLYTLLHLYHDFSNPQVGHHVLLVSCNNRDINEIMCIIGLLFHLFSLWHYYHTYDTLISPSKFIKINYKIFHYDTIIPIISLITTTWYYYHYYTIYQLYTLYTLIHLYILWCF